MGQAENKSLLKCPRVANVVKISKAGAGPQAME